MELKTLLENLKKPVSYKWKIQSVPKKKPDGTYSKGNCVAYIDARDCMDTLDKYCEEGWQNEFYEVKGKVFCRVGIKINGEWFYRSDSGALEENEHVEHETTSKGETSDAFKRACVQWGIGRFLYEKDIIWISDEEYQANRFKINEFCKSREGKTEPPKKTVETPTGGTKPKAETSPDEYCPNCGEFCETKKGKTKDGRDYEMGNCTCGTRFFVNRKDLSNQPF